MERSKKSGIPIPKRVTPKHEQSLSPPLSPKNEEKEENCDKVRLIIIKTVYVAQQVA